MMPRTSLTHFFTALFLALLPAFAFAAPLDPIEDAAEAKRLYSSANDYVVNINEGPYSYDYIQFHWKLSQANIERILRVYPETPTARSLAAGQLKLGEFDLSYFKDRDLSRLEETHLAAFDAVNCAIFL